MNLWQGEQAFFSRPNKIVSIDGAAQRKVVGRKSLGDWKPETRGHDALATILAQNTIRDQRLLPLRHGRMAATPWTYYRGAAAVMAADLASAPNTGITVQLCGDAHVLNFGLWKTPERNLAFDLRDFDETLPGPFEWDVKRFLASLVILARANGVEEHAKAAVAAGFAGYRDWIARYSTWPEIDIWYDSVSTEQLLDYATDDDDHKLDKLIEKRAEKRSSRGAFRKLTDVVDGVQRITEDPPYRTHALRDHLAELESIITQYQKSVPDHISSLWSRFDLVDAVQQVVGVGSVGMRVFLTLSEERRTGDPMFLQVKQAAPSVYEQFLGESPYDNHGSRVIHGQRMIQSATDMFVGWTSIGDDTDQRMDFYVRQFRDGKVIPKGEMIAPRLSQFATACGHVLARAHARSGDVQAIHDYLGSSDKAADSFGRFAFAYADQNDRDHAQLAKAVDDGTVDAVEGWPGQ
ncbi:DUF2252 domain-containing protein [Gordonia sp. PDNC005]|uniref:DUF2252 domain-containing protein n=1 Tax=unclassified Gordonia (in: high G+C Gram-positive bacteria) TaxID=2657482 RepID=UPI00196680FF|nr:DUF2252 domain-containing protein [Gordonia sp. PDNC005]QRY63226.1 DUF2252 domain-containing protein [Gordonia sp. PDNC005]